MMTFGLKKFLNNRKSCFRTTKLLDGIVQSIIYILTK